ncbi:glycine cleavage system protein GcvH [Crenobacter cavernae]|uniref:Glycine cleavage system H protein n=1 Tax=Crenobacter cavernae TaxID=2290923 RepID=A0ABY0FI13_9NEIS|nr:glycine cleavage system protein GcvH [Crenobacter cavernae]RXZ44942.1 glycine cleavage system protein GcvH [Crenobacter cavernae]
MSEIKFTESHEWLRSEADGVATVGITGFAQEQLGDIVFVQLPKVGEHFSAGDEAATIESVKAAGEIKIPVAGTIVEVNAALEGEPSLVNDAPLADGWFFKVKLDDAGELDGLLNEAAYQQLVGDLA